VAVKIEHAVYQSAKMFGRHFDDNDELLSHVTRTSIDVLKVSFQAMTFPFGSDYYFSSLHSRMMSQRRNGSSSGISNQYAISSNK
jgi:hypothetical protein